jgi:S-adenosylmethionine decarboxylase
MKAQMHNFSQWVDETDPGMLVAHYESLLSLAGFKVLEMTSHHFDPQGYTALFLLAESHFAIHTFPEEGTAYIELSSCVREPFLRFLAMHGSPQTVTV